MLGKGHCIVRVNSIERQFLLKMPVVERKSLTCKEIDRKNQAILDHVLNLLTEK